MPADADWRPKEPWMIPQGDGSIPTQINDIVSNSKQLNKQTSTSSAK